MDEQEHSTHAASVHSPSRAAASLRVQDFRPPHTFKGIPHRQFDFSINGRICGKTVAGVVKRSGLSVSLYSCDPDVNAIGSEIYRVL